MPGLPLAGPSGPLRSVKAGVERTVNWFPAGVETTTGKGGAAAYLRQCPGITAWSDPAIKARGAYVARGVLFVVSGDALYEIASDGSKVKRGWMLTPSGRVQMAANRTQLAITDGQALYIYDLDARTYKINPDNWRGSVGVDVLDGYGIFCDASTAQMYITAGQDFTSLDPLDFVSAEGQNGKIVGFVVKHREILILKEDSGEHWYDSGDADFPLARNQSGNIEVGCMAGETIRKAAGSVFWLGRDTSGGAVVFAMSGYAPARVSTHALEEKLQAVADLSQASAWTYHHEGFTFYCLQVPGVDTTWCYEVSSGMWHERAEWELDHYKPFRCSGHVYAYGKHVAWSDDGPLYVMSSEVSSYAGAWMVRSRITPHMAGPGLNRVRYGSLQADCDVGMASPGQTPSMMMRYSNDGGRAWSGWRLSTLGKIGEHTARARWTMLGSGRDRVWELRVTDDVMCNVLAAVVDES